MANSGYKNWLTLKKYINGVATDETKTNSVSDPDYIAPVLDETACPPTTNVCPSLTSPIADQSAIVGSGNVSISLSSVFTSGDSDTLTYTATSTNTNAVTTQISGSTLILQLVGSNAASTTISVTASDGTCSATDSFVFTLTETTTTSTTTTTTTTTTVDCPALITIAETSFNVVYSPQSYTSLGGYCRQTSEDTEFGKWYIDISSTTPEIYIWEGAGGSNTSCPSGTLAAEGTEVSSWTYGENTITPASGKELYNTGITWTKDGQVYDIITEWSGGGQALDNVYAAPQCGETTTTTTTIARPSGSTYGTHTASRPTTTSFRAVWSGSYNAYNASALASYLTGVQSPASGTQYNLSKSAVTLFYNVSPYAEAGSVSNSGSGKVKWFYDGVEVVVEVTNVSVAGSVAAAPVSGTFIYNG
jgi:hypothetical protein